MGVVDGKGHAAVYHYDEVGRLLLSERCEVLES